MKKFVTDEELVDQMSDVITEIWKAKKELRSEFAGAMTRLQVVMLDRFDSLIERVDEKFENRFNPLEKRFTSLEKDVTSLKKDVIFLKKNVGLILKIVSNGKKKH